MSFSIGWILPRLAVGSAPENEADARRLQSLGVTHVLDVRLPMDLGVNTTGAPALYAPLGIRYHRTPMVDDGSQKPPATYVDAVSFIARALARPGTKVFVHCAAGMYRSPSVVYAALRAMGYSADDAWRTVRAGRSIAEPQYLPGAEASVPYLPRIEPDRNKKIARLVMVSTVFGAVGWHAARRRWV